MIISRRPLYLCHGKSPIEKNVVIPGYEDVEAGIVKWPLSVLRIRHKDEKRLIDLASHILEVWRGYTDEEAFVFAETEENLIIPLRPLPVKEMICLSLI